MRGPFFFWSLGSSDTVSCPEVSYFDDLALFISHDSPGKLCDSVVDITNRLTETMAGFGLELNMKAGKTECILSLRGRGTAEAQRQLARDGKQIILPTKYAKLRIVPKLLSSWHHPDENWVHYAGNCEEVQGHAWGISSYRAQGFCLKGDLPQHQAGISACSVGWHSLPWSCHVARIE